MFLSRLKIQNYRSIKEIDLTFKQGKNVIIGRNNAGKSNIVKAINLILGENSPTWEKSDNISQNDFHCTKQIIDGVETEVFENDLFIWCELTRDPSERLDYDELYNAYGNYIYSREIQPYPNRRSVPIRLPKEAIPADPSIIFTPNEDENREKQYVNPKLRHQGELERHLEPMYSFAFAFRASRTDQGEILKEMRFLYRENENADWVLTFRTPYRNQFIQSAIVPSFRDPYNQLKLSSWSWYGKLIRHLTKEHEQDEGLIQAIKGVAQIADGIFHNVTEQLNTSAISIAFPGTTVALQFNTEKRDDLYKSTLIYVDDGFRSQLTEKGSGIQSTTLIGLFSYYTRFVNTLTSALLCIEEPEIYLHPHARRVISDQLDDFLDGNRNQVIITTHSPEFIRTTQENINLILVQKSNNLSRSKIIDIKDFTDILVDSNQSELFFADRIVICENLDAYILRLISSALFPGELDKKNVTLISAGGKNRIPRLVKVLGELDMPIYILADFDFLLRDGDELRKKYNQKSSQSIQNLGEGYFSEDYLFGPQVGLDIYREINQIRAEIKKENEEQFYTAKRSNQLTVGTSDILSRLRNNGICILNGEIENLCISNNFLEEGEKFGMDRIFELSGRLDAGEQINSILDTSYIAEFLQFILKD